MPRSIPRMMCFFCALFMLLTGALAMPALAETAITPLPIDDTPGYTPDASCFLPDNAGYEDASLSIQIETTRAYDTTIMIARIKIADPSQLRTAMAARYGSTSAVAGSSIAKRYNAVLAINGDFFNFHNKGYLVRQGKLFRDRPDEIYDTLIIDDKGDFHIITATTKEKLNAFEGVMVNTFTFGPGLIVDGVKTETFSGGEIVPDKKTQRMCIAQTGPLSYLCVATEGPENKNSVGLTLPEMTEFMAGLNCQNAYNLDGGSSSTMVLNNKKINALDTGKVRQVCDIVYFATAVKTK